MVHPQTSWFTVPVSCKEMRCYRCFRVPSWITPCVHSEMIPNKSRSHLSPWEQPNSTFFQHPCWLALYIVLETLSVISLYIIWYWVHPCWCLSSLLLLLFLYFHIVLYTSVGLDVSAHIKPFLVTLFVSRFRIATAAGKVLIPLNNPPYFEPRRWSGGNLTFSWFMIQRYPRR